MRLLVTGKNRRTAGTAILAFVPVFQFQIVPREYTPSICFPGQAAERLSLACLLKVSGRYVHCVYPCYCTSHTLSCYYVKMLYGKCIVLVSSYTNPALSHTRAPLCFYVFLRQTSYCSYTVQRVKIYCIISKAASLPPETISIITERNYSYVHIHTYVKVVGNGMV